MAIETWKDHLAWRNLLFVAVCCVVFLSLMSVRFNYAYELTKNHQTILSEQANMIEKYEELNRSRVLILTNTPGLSELFFLEKTHHGQNPVPMLGKIEQFLAAIATNRSDMYRIQFINEQGQEIIRINQFETKTELVADNQLQNKADQYYFIEPMQTRTQSVYVSPLELNEEHGQIAVPYEPIMSYASAVINPDTNKKEGVLNVSQSMQEMFSGLAAANVAEVIVIDQDGWYLYHPDPTVRFGKQLGHDSNLRNDNPGLVQTIMGSNASEGSRNADGWLTSWRKIYYVPDDPTRYWVLLLRDRQPWWMQQFVQF